MPDDSQPARGGRLLHGLLLAALLLLALGGWRYLRQGAAVREFTIWRDLPSGLRVYMNSVLLEKDNLFLVPKPNGPFEFAPSIENRAKKELPAFTVEFQIDSRITNRFQPKPWELVQLERDASFILKDARPVGPGQLRGFPSLVFDASKLMGVGTFFHITAGDVKEKMRVHFFFE